MDTTTNGTQEVSQLNNHTVAEQATEQNRMDAEVRAMPPAMIALQNFETNWNRMLQSAQRRATERLSQPQNEE